MPAFLPARGGSPQRRSLGLAEPAAVPPIGREGRRWSSPPLDPAPRVVREPRFGHAFSDIPIPSPGWGEDRDFFQPAAPSSPLTATGKRSLGGAGHRGPARGPTKLAISRPGDRFEQEADRVAARAMDHPGPLNVARHTGTPVLSRQTGPAADAKPAKVAPAPSNGAKALAQGEQWIGTPYEYGGDSKKGIDCSHFVHRAYSEAGLDYAYLSTGSLPTSPNFSPIAAPLVGDVVLFGGHMGLHNPAPPQSGKTILSATSSGVSYGQPEWFGAVKGNYRYKTAAPPPGELQKKAIDGNGSSSGPVPSIVDEVLHSPGQALDAPARAFFEPRFGHDFSQVRVHADATAAESARAVNALAYTVGRNVVFGAGQYAPRTNAGQRLLAHELTHTIQQAADPGGGQARLGAGPPSNPAEREAEAATQAVSAGQGFSPTTGSSAQIARQERPDAGTVPAAATDAVVPAVAPAARTDAGVPAAATDAGAPAAAPVCPVAPIATITDADALAMEGGATLIWNNTTPGLQAAANSLVTLVTAEPGGSASIQSAYRPPAYQNHLREVWDKARALRGNTSPACAAVRTAVDQEMAHHSLNPDRPVAAVSNHSAGNAVDISWSLPRAADEEARIDTLAGQAGLRHPLHTADRPHFEL
jgi:cell wall-associated NlpC family hydrolase